MRWITKILLSILIGIPLLTYTAIIFGLTRAAVDELRGKKKRKGWWA